MEKNKQYIFSSETAIKLTCRLKEGNLIIPLVYFPSFEDKQWIIVRSLGEQKLKLKI